MKMQLGAEPKKVAILIGLLLVAAIVYFSSSDPAVGSTTSSTSTATTAQPASGLPAATEPASPGRLRGRPSTGQFTPRVRPKPGEQRPDPMTIDPTLRLDVLAKLQNVNVEGTRRSLFDFSQPPVPKPDPVKEAKAKPVPNPIVPTTPVKPVDAANVEPAKPQAPPIPLKFYGYVDPSGPQAPKRAFFMEGEDIFIAREGETVKKRYKVVRIGVNSVVMEDTQFGSQQTLPLEEQPG